MRTGALTAQPCGPSRHRAMGVQSRSHPAGVWGRYDPRMVLKRRAVRTVNTSLRGNGRKIFRREWRAWI